MLEQDRTSKEDKLTAVDSLADWESAWGKLNLVTSEPFQKTNSVPRDVVVVNTEPRMRADGLVRTSVHYQSPEMLRAGRIARNLHPSECDVVVIGGGPGGLAATYEASALGMDVVLLEGHLIGSSMSDALAYPVHLMRTSCAGSTLFRSGVALPESVAQVGMPAVMNTTDLRRCAVEGRAFIRQTTSRSYPQWLPDAQETHDSDRPVTRGEIFGYFCHVADKAISNHGATIVELSPVDHVLWDESIGRFHVTTTTGHTLTPKYLVVATGSVGQNGELARDVPIISQLVAAHPNYYLQIGSESTVRLLNKSTSHQKQPIISDCFIGQPEVMKYLEILSSGTRAAVIGSGESAAKAVMSLLEVNPHMKVDLFLKAELEPAQGQAPSFGNIEGRILSDPSVGKRTLNFIKKHFGTPITPETMLDMMEQVRLGNVRIFELGSHFDSSSVKLIPDRLQPRLATRILLNSGNTTVIEQLVRQESDWKARGIMPKDSCLIEDKMLGQLSNIDGPIILAAGYDRKRLKHEGLLGNLLAQGLVRLGADGEFELDPADSLFSVTCPQLAFAGANNFGSAFDSYFSGAGTRGVRVAHALHARRNGVTESSQCVDHTNSKSPDNITAQSILEFRGAPALRDLLARQREGQTLSLVESFVLERGARLAKRVVDNLRAEGFI